MHNAMQFVLSNPVEGMSEEFNRWYAGPHMDHTLNTSGILAGQRFARRPGPWPSGTHDYLTIWELDDPASTLEALSAAKFTDRMPISPAIDMAGLQPPTMWHRATVRTVERVPADSVARATLVLVLANATADGDDMFAAELLSGGLARLADTHGVLAAHFFTLAEEQIRGNARKYRFGVILDLWDEIALESLAELVPALPALDADRWLAPVFTASGPRMTAADPSDKH
ncbi:MAG TPA: hypothetical protein VNS80_04400 [Pseudolysinimonas sp.]|nr:hypothetical protein [Pseudolysinimonas sp.]